MARCDPRTGAILAMYGNPTFDPNLFAVHSGPKGESGYEAVINNYNKLLNSPGDPLINYATAQAKAPGSTFKVVDTSAIFDHAPKLATECSLLFPMSRFPTRLARGFTTFEGILRRLPGRGSPAIV